MTARDLEVVPAGLAKYGIEQRDIDAANDYLSSAFRCTATLAERFAKHRLAHQPPAACEDDHKLKMIISHATGGSCQDTSLSINDICVLISANRNMIYEAGKQAALSSAPVAPVGEGLREALEKMQSLIDHIKQTPANLWWIDAEDPETVACEASRAISSLRDQIEADSRLVIAPEDKADLASQMKQSREGGEDKSWSSQ